MGTSWDIRFPKEMQLKATEKRKQLFAIGFLGGGRGEACMFWDAENITLLWSMAHKINRGMSPRDAFEEAEKEIKSDKKLESKEVS